MENLTQVTTAQDVLTQCAQFNVNTTGITVELLTSNSVLFEMYKQQLATAIKSHTDKMRNAKLERINEMKGQIVTDLQKYADVLAELGMTTKDNSLFMYAWNVEGKVEISIGNKTISKERMQTNGENAIIKTKYDWTATHNGVTYENASELAKLLGIYKSELASNQQPNYRKVIESHATKNPALNIAITRIEK